MSRLVLLLVSILLMGFSAADSSPDFHPYSDEGGRVRDAAGILSPEAEKSLSEKLAKAQAKWGPQMGVVTVSSLEGYAIEDFSLSYARAWGLGDAHRNDGLLLLVAPNERRVRIEVGKGIERTFTDIYCKTVINRMIDDFRSENYEGGVVAGVDELLRHMQRHPTIPANDNQSVEGEKAA